jgi:serine/threonine protein kinase
MTAKTIVEHLLQCAQTGDENFKALQGFVFERELGGGGMGNVFLLRRLADGQLSAIKVMKPEFTANEISRRLFGREIMNMIALNHPNIVRLYDFGGSTDVSFFTMEYCNAGSAFDLMAHHGGKLPVEKAKNITLQALRGLEYAHSANIPNVLLKDGSFASGKGLVHRDLKPLNLLLSGHEHSQTTKIADFGLAKAYQLAGKMGLTNTGDIRGTWGFMPRQLVLDYKYAQPDVDVWSMAASLYYMLTGITPRDFSSGRNPEGIVLRSNPVPICRRDPSIPEGLAKVIDQALIDKPEIYFKSATEFRQALETV